MIVTIYRVKCEGPCGRYLNDVVGGQASMTIRPSSALTFQDTAEALRLQGQLFAQGLCPRCASREA